MATDTTRKSKGTKNTVVAAEAPVAANSSSLQQPRTTFAPHLKRPLPAKSVAKARSAFKNFSLRGRSIPSFSYFQRLPPRCGTTPPTIETVAEDSALPAGGNLLLSHLRLCIGIQLCCHGVQSFCPGIVSAASQIEDKRSDLEWHVFIRGQQTYWLGLEHPQLIIPWVYLDTPANRQRSNDVSCVIGCRFIEHGGGDGYSRTTGDPIAQMRADEVRISLDHFLSAKRNGCEVPDCSLYGEFFSSSIPFCFAACSSAGV
jgi:hypothetical protein